MTAIDELYDAYKGVVDKYNTAGDIPITEPRHSPTMISNRRAAQLALAAVGRPTDDPLAIQMAEVYLNRLAAEERDRVDGPKQLDNAVIDVFFPAAGCIPTPEAWLADDEAEKHAACSELLDHLDRDHTIELVKVAMPHLLARIIAADAARRATGPVPAGHDHYHVIALSDEERFRRVDACTDVMCRESAEVIASAYTQSLHGEWDMVWVVGCTEPSRRCGELRTSWDKVVDAGPEAWGEPLWVRTDVPGAERGETYWARHATEVPR